MPATAQTAISVIGIDIGKNSFHIVGLDDAAQLCCVRNGRAAKWRHGSRTYRGA
jgi:hypothetical protein